MKHILYLTEDNYSTVHENICKYLRIQGADITLLVINRKNSNREYFNVNDSLTYLIKPEYNSLLYKYVFFYKRKRKWSLISRAIKFNSFDLLIASTMFSDGSIAYMAYKKYGIPYIILVRGTDCELYLKKLFHLFPIGSKIANNAKKIICISNSLKVSFEKSVIWKIFKIPDNNKISVIPNGIDDYWIKNYYCNKYKKNIATKLLYVGVFDNNKDVVNLISAFKKALIIKPDLELTLVGGGGNQENEVIRETLESKAIHYLGVILDKDELKKVYRSNDLFIMTSHSETFGLVYLEALSQGLPIIYSRGIGIDGTFPNMSIGESCDSHSEDEICEAIIKVASNYRNYDLLSVKQMMMFSWNNVALQYKKNFEECVV